MTELPGKQYLSCDLCGRMVQVYPEDASLRVWGGWLRCAACQAMDEGPHDDEIRDGGESPQ